MPSSGLKIVASSARGDLQFYPLVLSNPTHQVLMFQPSGDIPVVHSSGGGYFSVSPLQTGLFLIRYIISGSATETTIYETPEDSLAVVTRDPPPSTHTPYSYFTRGGLSRGQLGVGCCQYAYTLPGFLCSSSLHLASSCSWSGVQQSPAVQTNGVVFLKASDLDLPLSIAGLEVNSAGSKFEVSVPIQAMGQTGQCSQCSQCNNCRFGNRSVCYAFNRNTPFDEYDIANMVTQHSILTTFLTKTNGLLPSWLSASINAQNIAAFSSYDFIASINQPSFSKGLQGCGELTFENTGLLYVLRTRTPLEVSISGQMTRFLPALVSPLCFAIDVCSGSQPTLEVVLGDKFTPPLSDLNYFSALSVLGWNFKVFSVSFTGLGVTTSVSDKTFWNGGADIVAKLPSYDFKLLTEFAGNLTGGNLTVTHSFRGSLLHKSVTRSDEVSSQEMDNHSLCSHCHKHCVLMMK